MVVDCLPQEALQRSTTNAAGRLAGVKRTSDILLALVELEDRRREAEMRHEEQMQSIESLRLTFF